MIGRRGAQRILVGELESNRLLGRYRRRWKDNIKRVFKKWDGSMDWTHLAQDRDRRRDIMNVVMNHRVS
jgi:hypothetical protein